MKVSIFIAPFKVHDLVTSVLALTQLKSESFCQIWFDLLWTLPTLFNSNLGPLIPSPAWYHWSESLFFPPPLFSAPTSESLSLCRSPATQTWTHFKASATGITSSSSPFPIFLLTGTWVQDYLQALVSEFTLSWSEFWPCLSLLASFHLSTFWLSTGGSGVYRPVSWAQALSHFPKAHHPSVVEMRLESVSLLCRASPALIRLKSWRPIVWNVIPLIKLLRPQFCGAHHC